MSEWITNFLTSTFLLATPTLLAGLGAVFSERAGIVNIGVEGLMLIATLMGVIGSWTSGSVVVGAFVAMISCVLFSMVFAFLTIRIKASQVVVGIAMNVFAAGFTVMVNRLVFSVSGNTAKIDIFDKVSIPLLNKIPVLGNALFNQPIPVYLAFLAVPVAHHVMHKTRTGLHLRAVGENPKACDSLGINVERIRFLSVLYSGALAGLAGAFISMGQVSFFSEGMISGKGFMAVAAVVFGNYNPVGVMVACLIFGAAESLQYRLQAANIGIPYQFLMMLPYLITIVALCVYKRRSNKPACSGQAYYKE